MSAVRVDSRLLENHLQAFVKTCGFTYSQASSGDSQGGGDGGGNVNFEGNEFYWKFESKSRFSEYNKPVTLNEMSDKILDIMSQDNSTWPNVFCLFTPHHKLFDQMERKIHVLEQQNRIPFKVVVWDLEYIAEKLICLMTEYEVSQIFPGITINRSTDRDRVIASFVADIETKTRQGILLKRAYLHTEESGYPVKEFKITKKSREVDGVSNFFEYEILFNNKIFIFTNEKIESFALKRVPFSAATSQPVPINVVANPSITLTEINIVDWPKRNQEILDKKREIISEFKIINSGGISLFDEIKNSLNDNLIIRVVSTVPDISLIPFYNLNENDFDSANKLIFMKGEI